MEQWQEQIWESSSPARADQAVATLTGLSRSQCAAWFKAGRVRALAPNAHLADGDPPAPVGTRVLAKADLVAPGESVWLLPLENAPLLVPTPYPLEVLYEDEHVIAVNKPVGMAAHGATGWNGPTVLGALIAAGKEISTSGDEHRMGVVSRLDVGTTGVMILAKREAAYLQLQREFKARTPLKVYHALVQGCPDPRLGTIEAPIGRHATQKAKMCVRGDGREAITHYNVLEELGRASLIEIKLHTGRTHQIRVHMQAISHPVVGDPMYGADPLFARQLKLERQWLHARLLRLKHPITGEELEIEAPYPEDLRVALRRARELAGRE